MVMDYEKGELLSDSLRRAPQPEESLLKRILLPLLDGLQAVHREGFLHLDIKPGNIVIRDDGSPVLLDFGAARLAIGDWRSIRGGGRRMWMSGATPCCAARSRKAARRRRNGQDIPRMKHLRPAALRSYSGQRWACSFFSSLSKAPT